MNWWPRFRRRARGRRPRVASGGVAPPPLTRTTKTMPLVAGSHRVGARSHEPRLIDRTLVHDRNPLASGGLVLGLATPARPQHRSFPLVFRRRAARRPDSAPVIGEGGAPVVEADTFSTSIDEAVPESAPGEAGYRRRGPDPTREAQGAGRAHAPGTTRGRSHMPEAASNLPSVPLVGQRPLLSDLNAPEPVPDETRARIGRRFGVDLSEVIVRRGVASDDAASRLRARAFTSGDEIHVPARHGEFGSTEADALAAHELVHVAQRRVRGPELPPEGSPLGRILEAQARAEEEVRRGPHPGPRRHAMSAEPTAVPLKREAERQPPPSPPGSWSEPVRRATADHDGGAAADGAQAEDLFDRLYERIRGRLRHELIIDRERAGSLSDPS